MKHIKLFEELNNSNIIEIDGFKYEIKKAHFDMNEFKNYERDTHPISDKYYHKSYVVIEKPEDYLNYDELKNDEPYIRVRLFECPQVDDVDYYFISKKRGRTEYNSDDITCCLEHGDECMMGQLYEILATNNSKGEVYYDYLDRFYIHEDLKKLPKIK